MKKEYLIELKKKISQLSEEELKERDLYLRGLSNGEIQGPPTGYPSIDKPQLKYYGKTPIKIIDPNQTIYDLIFNNNGIDVNLSDDDYKRTNDEINSNIPALEYLGVKYNKKQLQILVDKYASKFSRFGLKKGDKVLFGVSNSIQSVASILAVLALGGTVKLFDVRASEEDIIEYANSSNCKMAVLYDLLIPKIESSINKTNLEKVFVINAVDDLPMVKRKLYFLKMKLEKNFDKLPVKLPNNKKFEKLNKFSYKDTGKFKKVEFDKDREAIMVQSSGTTGKAKTIVHSEYSCTLDSHHMSYSGYPFGVQKKALDVLPPWIAYGLGNSILTLLVLDTEVILSPTFDSDVICNYLGKFTVGFAAPFHYRYLLDNFDKLSDDQKQSLKKCECLISGGDKLTAEENKKLEDVLGFPVLNGYGNNEAWGSITFNPLKNRKYGTVGIPKIDSSLISYDIENNVELPYGEVGELFSISDVQFLYYEKNKEKTNEIKGKDEFGKNLIRTGDYGYIDNDGFAIISGRKERVIVRQGWKISAYTIEDAITSQDFVKECVTVAVDDQENGKVPFSFVVLEDNVNLAYEDAIELIKTNCKSKLKENEIPSYFEIVKELPYTQNNKYDFSKLEHHANCIVSNVENNAKQYVKKYN